MGWEQDSPFTADLPNLSPPPTFALQEQAKKWVKKEFDLWSWLWTEPQTTGTLLPKHFSGQRSAIEGLSATLAADFDLAGQRHLLRNAFQQTFHPSQAAHLPPSGSETGARILSIYDALGADAGRWAYQLFARNYAIGQLQHADDLTLFLAAASFDEDAHGHIAVTLKQERARYRSEISKLQNQLARLEGDRMRERANEAKRVRNGVRRLLRQTKSVWERTTSSSGQELQSALTSIADTEDKYRNQMALLAPVQYWKDKAKVHAGWEAAYGAICILFFAFAAYVIFEAASGTIAFLEALGEAGRASAYFITAGALLGGTTLLFWIGRVLVKLFLSEHHLRSECAEKAIMTQAFLSMETNSASFGETERAIVLASIFRASPDGIVKDEGPSDLAGTAILAKLLAR